MRAEIICVGDELLRGYVVNTNSAYLSQRLAGLGYDVNFQTVVGDSEKDIFDAIRMAVTRSHIIIFTGGLGPTADDMTKEVVAKALGMRLIFDETTAANLEGKLGMSSDEMSEAQLKQAYVIDGCTVLKNENGTAPGILLQKGNQVIVLMPGPPAEMKPMFENSVKPLLMSFSDVSCASATLRVVGLREPAVEETLGGLLYGANPHAALYVSSGEVLIRVFAKGADQAEADTKCAEHVSKIREVLGSYVYGEGDRELNEVVVNLLKDHDLKLATAESCTGGLLAARITEVPGSAEVFDYGVTCYADWVKKHALLINPSIINKYSAVSSQTAGEMAKRVIAAGKADVGLSITGNSGTEEVPGDSEKGLVYIGSAYRKQVVVKRFQFGNLECDSIRELSVKNALDMVRRMILGIEIPDGYKFKFNEITGIDTAGKPKKTQGFKIKRGLATGLALVLTSVVLYGGFTFFSSYKDKAVYDRIRISYEKSGADVSSLTEENENAAGWLSIGGLTFDGVIVKTEDETYYRTHDFYGNSSSLGCLYFSPRYYDQDLASCENVVINGKSKMIPGIARLASQEGLRDSYTFSLAFDEGKTRDYKIFSVFYADSSSYPAVDSTTLTDGRYSFVDFVVDCKMRSQVTVDLDVVSGDRFATIVTDSDVFDGAKLVIVAREIRDGETEDIPEEKIYTNISAVNPGMWYEQGGVEAPNVEVQRDYWRNWLAKIDVAAEEEIISDADNYEEWLASDDAVDPTEYVPGPNIDGSENTPAIPEPESSGDSEATQTGAQISVTSYSTGKVYTGTPVEIISMIVEAEVGSSFNKEAIKAQAIATITFYKYSSKTSNAPTFPLKTASSTVTKCVEEVINMGLYYNGSIIYSPYTASAAGATNKCSEVWVQDLPYLQSVESKYDYLSSSYNYIYTYNTATLRTTLENYYEITLSDDPNNWIQIVNYTSGGYVGTVSIDGQYTTTGSRLRSNCLHIRSAAFTYTYDASSDTITIETSGYGHGVGLSQWGAHYYASKENWTYDQILKHYYTGVEIGGVTW